MPKAPRTGISSGSRALPSPPRTTEGRIGEEIRRTTKPTAASEAIARFTRAVDLLERGDMKGAAREARSAKELAPRSPAVREVLGIALYGLDQWQDALRELQAYRRMTGRVDQNHLIADSLRGLGRPAEAVPLAEEELG